jgi:hypothetical protein
MSTKYEVILLTSEGTEGALQLGGWDEGGKAGFPGYRLFRPYGTASVAGSIQALTRKCISLSAFE